MNKLKIIGVTGVSVFNSLIGLMSAQALLNLHLALEHYIFICFLTAFIQGGLAFFKELVKESRGKRHRYSKRDILPPLSFRFRKKTSNDKKIEAKQKDGLEFIIKHISL